MLNSGKFQDVTFKGVAPTMTYKNKLIDGYIAAMKSIFEMSDVVTTTRVLNLKHWPEYESPD